MRCFIFQKTVIFFIFLMNRIVGFDESAYARYVRPHQMIAKLGLSGL